MYQLGTYTKADWKVGTTLCVTTAMKASDVLAAEFGGSQSAWNVIIIATWHHVASHTTCMQGNLFLITTADTTNNALGMIP